MTPEMTALNPWELHNFTFYHFAVPLAMTCITGYSLSGDVPAGISVDGAGTIKGKVKHFGEQPSCSQNKPSEKPELDGKNWNNNGRYAPEVYTFHFTITCHHLDPKSTPNGVIPCAKKASTSASCILTMVKDHNIDNKIWNDNYNYPIGEGVSPSPLQAI